MNGLQVLWVSIWLRLGPAEGKHFTYRGDLVLVGGDDLDGRILRQVPGNSSHQVFVHLTRFFSISKDFREVHTRILAAQKQNWRKLHLSETFADVRR